MSCVEAESPWGHAELMALAAFRYCLGQHTYIVGDCADWLIAHWQQFSEHTRQHMREELEAVFSRDDLQRQVRREPFPLGSDCDRRDWERVRALWRSA